MPENNPEYHVTAQTSALMALAHTKKKPIPPILYKYLAPDRIDVLEQRKIRFTQPASFNDPFDSRPPAKLSMEAGTRRVQQRADNDGRGQWMPYELVQLHGGYKSRRDAASVGILSLSERRDSLLMWSHYTDSHRGFTMGLDARHEFLSKGSDVPVLEEYPAMMLSISSLNATGPSIHPVAYVHERPPGLLAPGFDLSIADCVFKASEWSYEYEWRAFRSLGVTTWLELDGTPIVLGPGFAPQRTGVKDLFGSEVVLFDVPPAAIVEIVLGINMDETDRTRIARCVMESSELRHVRLMVAEYAPQAFGLVFREVTPAQLLAATSSHHHNTNQESLGYWDSTAQMEADVREAVIDTDLQALQHIQLCVRHQRQVVDDYKRRRAESAKSEPIPEPFFLSTIPAAILAKHVDAELDLRSNELWESHVRAMGAMNFDVIREHIQAVDDGRDVISENELRRLWDEIQ